MRMLLLTTPTSPRTSKRFPFEKLSSDGAPKCVYCSGACRRMVEPLLPNTAAMVARSASKGSCEVELRTISSPATQSSLLATSSTVSSQGLPFAAVALKRVHLVVRGSPYSSRRPKTSSTLVPALTSLPSSKTGSQGYAQNSMLSFPEKGWVALPASTSPSHICSVWTRNVVLFMLSSNSSLPYTSKCCSCTYSMSRRTFHAAGIVTTASLALGKAGMSSWPNSRQMEALLQRRIKSSGSTSGGGGGVGHVSLPSISSHWKVKSLMVSVMAG
mmetsp:Transcript_36491/g.65273  ORF Transcript_36491/g.65273 Transcript_36491/m.65273 type:complete len:272 (+) Transcript_36491:2610-3425(+)